MSKHGQSRGKMSIGIMIELQIYLYRKQFASPTHRGVFEGKGGFQGGLTRPFL